MDYSPDLHAAFAEALRVATRRRQAFCTSEQVLETLLLRAGQSSAAKPLTLFLQEKACLPFTPPSAELSHSLRSQIIPTAEALARADGAH